MKLCPKPPFHDKYKASPITTLLDVPDRFNVSWEDATNAISKKKKELLAQIGLPEGSDVRLLEALEWNLLGNREGWGKTDSYEWTNTELRGTGASRRLVAGRSDFGGASVINSNQPEHEGAGIGFRIAVVFGH